MSNMKIGTAAGKYSKCIVLGPFKTEPQQKEKRHQSASVNSHSAPVFFCFRDGVGNQRRCTPFHSLEKSRSVTSFAGLAWPLCARMTRTTSDRCWMYGSRKQVPLAAAAVVVWVPGDTQVMSQSKAPGWLRCFSWLPWIEGDGLIRMEEKAWAVASPAPEVRRLKLLNNGASTDGTGGARGSDDGAGAEAGGGAGVVLVRCSSAWWTDGLLAPLFSDLGGDGALQGLQPRRLDLDRMMRWLPGRTSGILAGRLPRLFLESRSSASSMAEHAMEVAQPEGLPRRWRDLLGASERLVLYLNKPWWELRALCRPSTMTSGSVQATGTMISGSVHATATIGCWNYGVGPCACRPLQLWPGPVQAAATMIAGPEQALDELHPGWGTVHTRLLVKFLSVHLVKLLRRRTLRSWDWDWCRRPRRTSSERQRSSVVRMAKLCHITQLPVVEKVEFKSLQQQQQQQRRLRCLHHQVLDQWQQLAGAWTSPQQNGGGLAWTLGGHVQHGGPLLMRAKEQSRSSPLLLQALLRCHVVQVVPVLALWEVLGFRWDPLDLEAKINKVFKRIQKLWRVHLWGTFPIRPVNGGARCWMRPWRSTTGAW